MIEVPLQQIEVAVRYRLNGGAGIEFVVPKQGQNLRWAAHSCNGMFISACVALSATRGELMVVMIERRSRGGPPRWRGRERGEEGEGGGRREAVGRWGARGKGNTTSEESSHGMVTH